MPREHEKRPKFVLVSLGLTASHRYAIVNWHEKEVERYIDDRDDGLDLVRELNGVHLKPVRKHRATQQHSVRAALHAKPKAKPKPKAKA